MFMKIALIEAIKSGSNGEIPVGSLIVLDKQIISKAGNTKESLQDPSCHAEMNVIREASHSLNSWRLDNCSLYTTLEPCIMCAGAILSARIPKIIFGAWDEKSGAAGSKFDILRDRRLNHQVEVVSGIMAKESSLILKYFFNKLRKNK